MPQQKRYPSGTPFTGVMGRTLATSTPAWPEETIAKSGSPNILFIVLDDIGFAQLGCYGSDIETPNLDKLAANGLRYTNWHTTALCSPSRSGMLTGRNHHSNGFGCIAEVASGFPGYNATIPKENGMLPDILLPKGYATFCLGKWHLTPAMDVHHAAPRDRWPLGQGFERYYGFLGGATDQYYPELTYDNHHVEPPKTPEEGYHLSEDLADKAIEFINDLQAVLPEKPFFMYFAPGAMHAPHQAPKEWIDKYIGKFDQGWDKWREATLERQKQMGIFPSDTPLSPREPEVKAWDSLTPDEKKVHARYMEVFAGFLSHTDHHIGRVIDFLEKIGELDNTLIFAVSDNGASAEGGENGSVNEWLFFNGIEERMEDNLKQIEQMGSPYTYQNYSMGWTNAGDTPYRRWKREVYNGGICDPLILHWPDRIKAKGELRDQYSHAVDLVPTILELLNIEPPATIKGVPQSPIQGVSFADSFNNATAPTKKTAQYFEMFGQRAIWQDGWKAIANHPFGHPVTEEALAQTAWELYRVDPGAADPMDRGELSNLADKYPDKVQALAELWWSEAAKYNVLPLQGIAPDRLAIAFAETKLPVRPTYNYYPGGSEVPETAAVDLKNRSHSITVEVEIPQEGAEGVLFAHGGRFGGYVLFVKDGQLVYHYNYANRERTEICSTANIPEGEVTLAFEFTKTGEHQGKGSLFINGNPVGEADIPHTIPITYGINEGVTCGYDNGNPVTEDYTPPFSFTGTIHRVVVDTTGEQHHDSEKTLMMHLSKQ